RGPQRFLLRSEGKSNPEVLNFNVLEAGELILGRDGSLKELPVHIEPNSKWGLAQKRYHEKWLARQNKVEDKRQRSIEAWNRIRSENDPLLPKYLEKDIPYEAPGSIMLDCSAVLAKGRSGENYVKSKLFAST